MTKRIAVVGLGLIGKERLRSIEVLQKRGRPIQTVAVLDPFASNAAALAEAHSAKHTSSLDELFETNPDLVIVATPNDIAADVLTQAGGRGLAVLVEKPLGRTIDEARRLFAAAKGGLYVGFNYRFQPGIAKLIADTRSGRFGEIVSVRAVLGHGGEPGLVNSWKLDKEKIGGGCLLDPGIHLLDLCRLLAAKEPEVRSAMAWSGFWKRGIDEECHLLLDGGGFPMNVEVSIVRWRSTFELSVQGTEGYGVVTGRNRSYGPQRYLRGERWGWRAGKGQRDTETLVVETDGDDSFVEELDALLFEAKDAIGIPCDGATAVKVMDLYDRCARATGPSR